MPALVNFRGDNDIRCPLDAGLYLSLAPPGDVYYPPCKRSRVTAGSLHVAIQSAIDPVSSPKELPRSIDSLPDECLFEVLRRLPGDNERSISACVSKRWLMLLGGLRQEEIRDAQPLKIDLNDKADGFDDETGIDCNGCLTRCLEGKEASDVRLAAVAVGTSGRGGLGKLVIRGSNPLRGVTDLGISTIAHGCPSLRVLSLCDVPLVTDDGLSEIVSGCHLLEKLELSQCPLISDKGLIAVAKNCPNLVSLTIESCAQIGNLGFQSIGRLCPNLKSVSIKDCPLLGDQGIAGLVSYASTSLTKIKLLGLKVTDMSLALIGHYGKAITDLVFSGLSNVSERGFWVLGNALGLQNLKSFIVTSCRGMTDLGIEAVGKGCPGLKTLHLRRCVFLSDNGLRAFAKAAGSLENLQLEECNRITLAGVVGALLNSNAKFKSLSLVKCLGIRDIPAAPAELPSCNSLRSLTIRDCVGFGSSSLAAVGKLCPQLQNVDLSGIVGVTDDGLLPLIETCKRGLVKVSLGGCVNLTDVAVSSLAKLHGSTIQLLNLEGCKRVTDEAVMAITEGCVLLSDLYLSGCSITDYGVAALTSARQLELKVLSLSGCSGVSDRSLPLLSKIGITLAGLNLQHCNLISGRAIRALGEKMWWCDILS
ncbi:EIN3-binding F-box protein 2 [Acorus calamus]|uniref:EIN3-binding F-box protein 2 n=1 Tax=Acorus calamus TaxID=4465 RepID=A0AAV9C0J4_ACOCL|nr:EIN3-binding F-box protein 2 [Acorus calamus]